MRTPGAEGLDLIIRDFAVAQWGVVSRSQMREAGISRRAIEHRIDRGRLHEKFPDVYAVGHPTLDRLGWLWAAQLFGGTDATLSHRTAAEVLGVVRHVKGHRMHVTTPRRHRPHPWMHFHRATSIPRHDIDGLRVTTLERTLIDMGLTETVRTIELAINEAIINQDFDLATLDAAVQNARGHRGLKALNQAMKQVKEGLTPTDGEASEAFHDLIRRTNFRPKPLYQQRVLGFRPDFLWPDHKLVVEADGGRFHSTPTRRREDRIKDAALRAAGCEVLRFTYHQIVYEPDYVLRTLRAALDARTRWAG